MIFCSEGNIPSKLICNMFHNKRMPCNHFAVYTQIINWWNTLTWKRRNIRRIKTKTKVHSAYGGHSFLDLTWLDCLLFPSLCLQSLPEFISSSKLLSFKGYYPSQDVNKIKTSDSALVYDHWSSLCHVLKFSTCCYQPSSACGSSSANASHQTPIMNHARKTILPAVSTLQQHAL